MKKKILIGCAIAVVIIAIVAVNVVRSKGSVGAFNSGKTFDVKVQKIVKGNIEATISASGVIEEVEKQEIFFDTPLKVKKLLVQKNQKVTKGQQLVELDLDSLTSELEQAKINKTVQELALQKVGANGMANNSYRSAEITYNDAKKNYESNKVLFASNAISKSDMDRAEKAYKDAEIALNNARLGLSNQGVDVQSQQENLKATVLRVTDLEAKLKKINECMVSPIDGAIAEVNIVEGAFTSNMQAAFKIVNPEKLKVKADIKEFDLKKVAIGQDVKITGDAIDKNEGIMGKVESISPVARSTKTANGDETLVEATISIVKGSPILKPGLSVTCDVITQVKNDVPIVSFEMLKEDKDGNKTVFVLDKNNIMHETKVKLGATSDLNAEVLEGVKEGDNVVLNVLPSFKDGSKAKIIKDEKK